jgi:hypothetical protein
MLMDRQNQHCDNGHTTESNLDIQCSPYLNSNNILNSNIYLCLIGVHCGIYKCSYNISNMSYLNSPCPPFFISLPPLLEKFQQISFFCLHTCIHTVCAIFTLPCPFPAFSPFPLLPTPIPHFVFPKD